MVTMKFKMTTFGRNGYFVHHSKFLCVMKTFLFSKIKFESEGKKEKIWKTSIGKVQINNFAKFIASTTAHDYF